MNTEINEAIAVLVKHISDGAESNDAIRYSQAALNLAHVINVLGEYQPCDVSDDA